MKVLEIIETAYRATIEEQDDPVLWITHAMRNAGAQLDVVLRGDAVNYAVAGQDASGLAFGDWRQTQPPRLPHDLAALAEGGAAIFCVTEDCQRRGLDAARLIGAVEHIPEAQLATLVERYDRVWHW